MAKTQSLAAQAGVLKAELQLPSVFSAPQEKIQGRFSAPYVTFAHPKRADEWAKIVGKYGAPNEGDMFLVEPTGVTKMDTMKAALLCARQAWTVTNAAGDILTVHFEEKPGTKELVVAALLVYLEDRVVPANIKFKTTKCRAAKELADALAEAATPEWADKSPAHKDTMVVGYPFGRYYGLVKVMEARPSKTSGTPYRPTSTVIAPTGMQEWKLLKAFSESEGYKDLMDAASRRFESDVEELKKKAK